MSKLLQRLMDPSRSGVYRIRALDDLLEVLRGSDVDCVRISLRGARSKEAMLRALADALQFPQWFGANWDAAEDWLGDLSWRGTRPRVLVFEDFEMSDELGILLDVLASSAEYWAGRASSFFAVFVDPQKTLPLADLYRERGA